MVLGDVAAATRGDVVLVSTGRPERARELGECQWLLVGEDETDPEKRLRGVGALRCRFGDAPDQEGRAAELLFAQLRVLGRLDDDRIGEADAQAKERLVSALRRDAGKI